MSEKHHRLTRNLAAPGKYAALYRHLEAIPAQENKWEVSFVELETILGFSLPESARLHRPWWANQKFNNGHSHAWAWQAAGWVISAVEKQCSLTPISCDQPSSSCTCSFFNARPLSPHLDPGVTPNYLASSCCPSDSTYFINEGMPGSHRVPVPASFVTSQR